MCIIYTVLCASALSERLLGKDFLLHFSHFLLEVMPEHCVPVPNFLTRITSEVLPLEVGVCLASIPTIIGGSENKLTWEAGRCALGGRSALWSRMSARLQPQLVWSRCGRADRMW